MLMRQVKWLPRDVAQQKFRRFLAVSSVTSEVLSTLVSSVLLKYIGA